VADAAGVHLEPWGPDDLGLVEQLMGDPVMAEHVGGPETPEKLAERQARYAEPGSGMYKIIDESSGQAVGSVGFWERDWRGRTVWETGWSVIPAFQRRGIAARATAQLIELARAAGAHRLMHAYPSIENGPSNAICRKLGFTLLEEVEFEFPPGELMRCNDWQLELF
jgi:RimJ/RimL family protein N-acetyltransferase